jgi:hypothetical protein
MYYPSTKAGKINWAKVLLEPGLACAVAIKF